MLHPIADHWRLLSILRTQFSRRRMGRRGRIVTAVVVVLVLAGGVAAAIILKVHHDNQVRAEQHRKALQAQQAAAAAQAAQAAQRAQQAQQAAQNAVQVSIRRSLVNALQGSVTKDAQQDVNNGVLTGPILRTVCTPVGGGNLQDTLADHTGNWSCLAVTKDNPDGTSSGYGFAATINYDTGAYTWHLGNQ